MTPEDYECKSCHCSLEIPEGMDELDEDVRFCGPCAIGEIERLRTLHADSPTRNYGDGDANSLWNRIETFREHLSAKLSDEDVQELAEWWNELHQTVMELDDKPDLFPVFEIIDRSLKHGYYFEYQGGKIWLFDPKGEGMACGETFRELCVNIVLAGT